MYYFEPVPFLLYIHFYNMQMLSSGSSVISYKMNKYYVLLFTEQAKALT